MKNENSEEHLQNCVIGNAARVAVEVAGPKITDTPSLMS